MSALDDWIDICRVGKWKDRRGRPVDITGATLAGLVSAFATSDPVPVVVGHPETDAPAYGWIDQIRVMGDRLQAKLRDLDPTFRRAVEAGRYAGRSIAVGKNGLRHLAFLGGRQPAVSGLAPASFAAPGEDDYAVEFAASGGAELAGAYDREAALAAREEAVALAEARAGSSDAVDPHIRAGRVLPAERELCELLHAELSRGGGMIAFASAGEDIREAPAEAFQRFLSGLPVRVQYNELAGGPLPAPMEAADSRAELEADAEAARELIEEARARGESLTAAEATARVLEEKASQ